MEFCALQVYKVWLRALRAARKAGRQACPATALPSPHAFPVAFTRTCLPTFPSRPSLTLLTCAFICLLSCLFTAFFLFFSHFLSCFPLPSHCLLVPPLSSNLRARRHWPLTAAHTQTISCCLLRTGDCWTVRARTAGGGRSQTCCNLCHHNLLQTVEGRRGPMLL